MTYKEFVEFDRLMWAGSSSKRAQKLMDKWESLTKEQQTEYLNRLHTEEANKLKK